MSETRPGKPQFRIQLIDMAAMVVGYGLAAVLFRAFWPQSHVPPALGLFAIGFYVWLGLAMSGPLILLRQKHTRPVDPGGTQSAQPATSTARTWAEMAWLLIGVYWIAMGVFILPIRLHSFRFSDTILFGLVPLAAALVLRVFGPRIRARDRDHVSWTHQVAVGLLVTWPLAWVCLIVVAEAML
jgi:hypothetical protein